MVAGTRSDSVSATERSGRLFTQHGWKRIILNMQHACLTLMFIINVLYNVGNERDTRRA